MAPFTRPRALAIAGAAALILSGCATSAGEADLLVQHGLDGLSGQEVVEVLDASADARPLAFSASVRQGEVVVGDGSGEVALGLPSDQQYVSIAPFVDRTHECYYHSLATCQGELPEAEVSVTITDDDGTVLVAEVTETYANGFVGYWLPRDVAGTIEVMYGDYAGIVPFSTTDGSPTCITTLRLS